jgi:prevent-host-death family protein
MHEAKTHLSELVERARRGEEVIITSGRERKPVARIVALTRVKAAGRRPGLFKGVFSIRPDFEAPLPADELRYWTGE